MASRAAFVAEFTVTPEAATLQPGTYRLRKEMKASDALALLLDPASRQSLRVGIREGLWVSEVLPEISADTGFTVEELQAALADPAVGLPPEAEGDAEGFLFPATYDFEPDVTPVEILAAMVARYTQAMDDLGVPADQRRDVLIRASIVQGEASREEDLAKVARVIQNRIDAGDTLGMDSTVGYVVQKRALDLTQSDLETDSPYNTRLNPGLPPGPDQQPGRGGHRRGDGAGRGRLAVLRHRRRRHRRDRVHRRLRRVPGRQGAVPGVAGGQRVTSKAAVNRAAVLGRPVAHSLSPALHTAAYRSLGLTGWEYTAVDLGADELACVPRRARPHLGRAVADDAAQAGRGAAARPDHPARGRPRGGQHRHLRRPGRCRPALERPAGAHAAGRQHRRRRDHRGGASGAGGRAPPRRPGRARGGATAASALAAGVELGFPSARVCARSAERAAQAAALGARLGIEVETVALDAAGAPLADATVVVSALPAGAADLVAVPDRVRPGAVLLDVVYDPWPTVLAGRWERAGGVVVPGVEMLLQQAVQQVALMTGLHPDPEAMRTALPAPGRGSASTG